MQKAVRALVKWALDTRSEELDSDETATCGRSYPDPRHKPGFSFINIKTPGVRLSPMFHFRERNQTDNACIIRSTHGNHLALPMRSYGSGGSHKESMVVSPERALNRSTIAGGPKEQNVDKQAF